MAFQLTKTLIKSPKSLKISRFQSINPFSSKAQLIELDLDSSSSPGDVVVGGMQQLEDAIHGIIARRLQPDWIPFRPGSSYWVPPRKPVANNLAEIMGKLGNPLTHEESLSVVSGSGWPSSDYFIYDQGSPPMVEAQVYSQVYSQESENASLSVDEDEDENEDEDEVEE